MKLLLYLAELAKIFHVKNKQGWSMILQLICKFLCTSSILIAKDHLFIRKQTKQSPYFPFASKLGAVPQPTSSSRVCGLLIMAELSLPAY